MGSAGTDPAGGPRSWSGWRFIGPSAGFINSGCACQGSRKAPLCACSAVTSSLAHSTRRFNTVTGQDPDPVSIHFDTVTEQDLTLFPYTSSLSQRRITILFPYISTLSQSTELRHIARLLDPEDEGNDGSYSTNTARIALPYW